MADANSNKLNTDDDGNKKPLGQTVSEHTTALGDQLRKKQLATVTAEIEKRLKAIDRPTKTLSIPLNQLGLTAAQCHRASADKFIADLEVWAAKEKLSLNFERDHRCSYVDTCSESGCEATAMIINW